MSYAVTEALVSKAYARFIKNPGWSKEDFIDQLSAAERIAVHASNLNAQVNNGGFVQWHDNGYATPEAIDFLFRLLARINTPSSAMVTDLLERAVEAYDDFESLGETDYAYDLLAVALDTLDGIYYTGTDEDFLNDLEAYLVRYVTDAC